MARLVVDLPENSPGCIFIQRPGVRCPLPSGAAPLLVCRPFLFEPCEPELEC